MLQEFLWENTSVYRDILALGEEQGEKKGIELARANSRQLIEAVVQARFPDLLAALKEQVEQLNDLEKLQEISLLVSTAHNAEEVKRALLAL